MGEIVGETVGEMVGEKVWMVGACGRVVWECVLDWGERKNVGAVVEEDEEDNWRGGGEEGGDLMSLSFFVLEGVIMEDPLGCLRTGLSRLETNSGAMPLCPALSPSQFSDQTTPREVGEGEPPVTLTNPSPS